MRNDAVEEKKIMVGALSVDLRRKVARAVEGNPLTPREARGVPGVPSAFISLKDNHNGHVPVGAVNVGGGTMVNVFEVPSSLRR